MCLTKIRTSSRNCIIFKIKDHLRADINSSVLESIFEALYVNRNCQALYLQNLTNSLKDQQLHGLVNLLKKKRNIWCLNIGENYSVSNEAWSFFCNQLPNTSITHLYVSEHVISLKLKDEMRMHIRKNRKKHDMHCSVRNLQIIEKCTNMWW